MILYTEKKSNFGLRINLGGNIVTFDKEGKCDVTNEVGNILVDRYKLSKTKVIQSDKIVDKDIKLESVDVNKKLKEDFDNLTKLSEEQATTIDELIKENDLLKKQLLSLDIKAPIVGETEKEDKLKEEPSGDNDDNDTKDIVEKIKVMNVAGLKDLCKSMEFPVEEYNDLKIEKLREYIISKLK